MKFIKNNINKNTKFPIKKKKLENILINLKKKSFSESFSNYIKNNYSDLKSLTIKFPIEKKSISFKLKRLFLVILSFIKNEIILKTYFRKFLPQRHFFSKKYKIKKFNYLYKSEITNLFKKFSSVDKKKKIIKRTIISKVCQDVFEIKRARS